MRKFLGFFLACLGHIVHQGTPQRIFSTGQESKLSPIGRIDETFSRKAFSKLLFALTSPPRRLEFGVLALARPAEHVLRTSRVACRSPDFDTFSDRASGKWTGVKYQWGQTSEMLMDPREGTSSKQDPFQIAYGFMTPPNLSTSVLEERWRACGGSVQGLTERTNEDGILAHGLELQLNKGGGDFIFFNDGSWSKMEPILDAKTLNNNPDGFGFTVSLAHSDGTRRRLEIVAIEGEVAFAEVQVQGREFPALAQALMERRAQVIKEAIAWDGGADFTLVEASAPEGKPWLAFPPPQWEHESGGIDGGSSLLPSSRKGVAYLPGGLWVELSGNDGRRAVVGSLNEDGEIKELSLSYKDVADNALANDGTKHLRTVSLRHVTIRDEIVNE